MLPFETKYDTFLPYRFYSLHYFRQYVTELPEQDSFKNKLDLRSSWILRGVVWLLFNDVSVQRIGPIFRGQEFLFFLDFLTFEVGTDTLSRNVGKQLPHDAA
jgi:hypothetical protein